MQNTPKKALYHAPTGGDALHCGGSRVETASKWYQNGRQRLSYMREQLLIL